ncbi:MAG: bifunctional DNA-formamidopyrimidine glycosylase/DNA-(apurinic or apyrimidinic site) lyase [Verrucomicrobia bacterium]|nr:MAG: bifunctional DNA-formamidopyrimidine glycosylase/DNA-(apurinic or apyrimidinic site) lyase [Verrucomicrobiota bacterium]
MPELPEVEVLARHLRPLVKNKTIRAVEVRRARVIRPTSERTLKNTLTGAELISLERRGKYLIFKLHKPGRREPVKLLGHLGMTGRMFLAPKNAALPKHAAVVLDLGRERFVFEDTRYFGRFTLDVSSLAKLGPEPLSKEFSAKHLARELAKSRQPIKVKLLDQSLVAGVGNIYASEALFRARISPLSPANKLTSAQNLRLVKTIRQVLAEAIRFGSTVPLNHGQTGDSDGLFYFGRAEGAPDYYEERLKVYDRAGRSCRRCGHAIKRIVQAARSTFYCPRCQPRLRLSA